MMIQAVQETEISWCDVLIFWTMRKSRYAEAEGGESMPEACERFFRY